MIDVLRELQISTNILLGALASNDLEKANEAISVMILQGMGMLGSDHPAMQQFFPVWDAVQKHIELGDVEQATGQAETWNSQLTEVIALISKQN